ncbi:MAG TPA: hypothetical protein VGB63_07915 [Pedobacter sp.]|jgi:hypothetical protein
MAGALNPVYVAVFKNEFHTRCIQLVINAYYSAISAKVIITTLEEEDITAVLSRFIDDNPQRLDWCIINNTEDRLRDDKIAVTKGFAKKSARIDLRFTTINSSFEYRYYMEAKNLKERDSALKRRYIKTGIDNYVSTKYHDGFLVGYLLEGNVSNNVSGLNKLLIKDKRDGEVISISASINGYAYYVSDHTTIKIKHMFLDFT